MEFTKDSEMAKKLKRQKPMAADKVIAALIEMGIVVPNPFPKIDGKPVGKWTPDELTKAFGRIHPHSFKGRVS